MLELKHVASLQEVTCHGVLPLDLTLMCILVSSRARLCFIGLNINLDRHMTWSVRTPIHFMSYEGVPRARPMLQKRCGEEP